VYKLIKQIKNKESARQLLRYGLIGITTNVSAYTLYLLITYSGGTPKITMSTLYIAAAIASYYGNRKLTFSHNGSVIKSGFRFFLMHCLGYLINLCMLIVLVDKLAYPHQWVQILAIIVVAAFLFVTFKLFVFKEIDS